MKPCPWCDRIHTTYGSCSATEAEIRRRKKQKELDELGEVDFAHPPVQKEIHEHHRL